MKRISIFWILLIAFFINIFLVGVSLNYPQHPDISRYYEWAKISFLKGPEATYHKENISYGDKPNNLPPASIYTVSLVYQLDLAATKAILKLTNQQEGSLIWINLGYLSFIFLKIPSLLASVLTGYLIYLIIKRFSNEKSALLGSSLYLFNPVSLYNAAFWGQNDSVNTVLFILAILLLLTKHYMASVVSLTISLFYKLNALPLIPFLTYFYVRFIEIKKLIAFGIISAVFVILATLPMSSNPILWLINLLKDTATGETDLITLNAFNFWWAILHPVNPSLVYSSTKVFFLPLWQWSYLLFTLSILPLIFLMYKYKERVIKAENILLILSLASILFFDFLPKMHDRYLFIFFPLFAAYIGLTGRGKKLFALLTLVHLFNLMSFWHPFLTTKESIALIENYQLRWAASLLTLGASLILYKKAFLWIKGD